VEIELPETRKHHGMPTAKSAIAAAVAASAKRADDYRERGVARPCRGEQLAGIATSHTQPRGAVAIADHCCIKLRWSRLNPKKAVRAIARPIA
jgi:hypothetical protein